jgi:hypothetical protein
MRRILAAALALGAATCGGNGSTPASGSLPAVPGAPFVERARESGLDFVHFNGMSGNYYYPEMIGSGVALFDYDNDGDLDVYLVQGQTVDERQDPAQTLFPPSGPLRDQLFRNDLVVHPDGSREVRFADVTARSGIDVRSYGMGVAAGDIDNDGWVDLYRTGTSGSVMLRNNGDGTFTDVTGRSGTANPDRWGVSASFVDYDRDGWLDLFVGNYLEYSIAVDVDCHTIAGGRDYCPPSRYPAQPDRLYRNRGDGTFEEVTRMALAGGAYGPALGVSTADFDGDGLIDIYVGNDGAPNQLWMNLGDGTFTEKGFLSGTAVNARGYPEASMGIDAGDFDNDGDPDIFVTNWLSEMNVLYVNLGRGLFEDRKAASGLGPPSAAKTGFGTAFLDYDNDGWLDLLTVNGSVETLEPQARVKDPLPFKMTKALFRNEGNGRFVDVSASAGPVFAQADVGRGAAFGDIDNDGDIDVVVSNASGRVQLLLNEVGTANHWLGLRLAGRDAPRDMLGARVEIVRDGRTTLWRHARSDGSYASANDPRVLVGLGSATGAPLVRVTWPDGTTEEWAPVPIDRYTTIRQGTGKPR